MAQKKKIQALLTRTSTDWVQNLCRSTGLSFTHFLDQYVQGVYDEGIKKIGKEPTQEDAIKFMSEVKRRQYHPDV